MGSVHGKSSDPKVGPLEHRASIGREIPLEILTKIFEEARSRKQEWKTLCSVSKWVKSTVQLEIFKRIDLHSGQRRSGKTLSFIKFHDLLRLNKDLAKYPRTIRLCLDHYEWTDSETIAVIGALAGHRVEIVYLSAEGRSWKDLPSPLRVAIGNIFIGPTSIVGVELTRMFDFPRQYLRKIHNLVLIEASLFTEDADMPQTNLKSLAICGWKLSSPVIDLYSNSLTHLMISWEDPLALQSWSAISFPTPSFYSRFGELLAGAPQLKLLTVEYYVNYPAAEIRPYVEEFLRCIPSTKHRLSLEWRFRQTMSVLPETDWPEIEPIICAMQILTGMDTISFRIQHWSEGGTKVLQHALEVGLLKNNNLTIRLDEQYDESLGSSNKNNTYTFIQRHRGGKVSRQVHEDACPVIDHQPWQMLRSSWHQEPDWSTNLRAVEWKEVNSVLQDYE